MKAGLTYDIALKIFAQTINIYDIIELNLVCLLPNRIRDVIDFICECVRIGNRDNMLNYICKKIPIPEWDDSITISGNSKLIKWTYECIGKVPVYEFYNIAHSSPIDVFEFILEHNYNSKKTVFKAAVHKNRLDILEWLFSKYTLQEILLGTKKYNKTLIKILIKSLEYDLYQEDSYLKLFKYFKHIYPELVFDSNIVGIVADAKYWNIFTWLNKQTKTCNIIIINSLAQSGKLELLKEYYVSHPHLFRFVLYEATKNGHLDIIKWMVENKRNKKRIFDELIRSEIANYAANNGRMNILEWLKDRDILPYGVFYIPAIYNYLEILKWLHKHNIPKFIGKKPTLNQTIRGCIDHNNRNVIKWILETYSSEIDEETKNLTNEYFNSEIA